MNINNTSLASLISTDKPRGFGMSLLRQDTSDSSHFFPPGVFVSSCVFLLLSLDVWCIKGTQNYG